MDQQTYSPPLHQSYYNHQMDVQNNDSTDFTEMESMQFVNPHDVNPIIQLPETTSDISQVSSKLYSIGGIGSLSQNNIKLKMEVFSDLSSLLTDVKVDLTDELATPIFDKDSDFAPLSPDQINVGNNDLKVEVEYKGQLYQSDENVYRDLILSTDNQMQSMEHFTINNVGMDQSRMYLHQPIAHNLCDKTKTNDAYNISSPSINSLEASFDNNISIISNVIHTTSAVISSQEDGHSFTSSPSIEEQDVTVSALNNFHEAKPKLNLMIDRFSIKNEDSAILNTPDVIEEAVNLDNFNILDLVDNEEIRIFNPDDELLSTLSNPDTSSITHSTTNNTPPEPLPTTRRRRRRSHDSDDYIPSAKRSFIEDSNSSNDSDEEEERIVRKKSSKRRGRPPKRSDSLSGDGFKDTSLTKYRELRDKNNEASRKSRLKRRMKELEYEQEAEQLQSKNLRLKTQVEELEKMVSSFRNNLFKILVNK